MPELASSENTEGTPAVSPPYASAATVRADGDRVRVTISGELDLDASERLRGVLREALNRSVRGVDLDLEGVSFCDCSALNILLHLRHRALESSKTVVIDSAGAAVDRLLTLTGTGPLFGTTAPDETSEDAQHDLRIEVAQLRRAMQTRPTIDLARGILMASFSLSSEEAWTVLVTASQNTNTKLHSLADDLVTAVKGDALPDEVQEHLSAAVARIGSAAPGQ
ncbi:ANTAR domain-containing protein [Streptomyces muensis]|uniref:ANTAR domain-containing protein n=1 Tax=Streptomyces muensis TaxID=1077944 RepID=A0A9X1PT70_STRM4|nr:ANTAR domain-containing protein [Streptomyces muensis]MCF1592114.1 ANTAR domain-containing protein [Streptomyces muensis]